MQARREIKFRAWDKENKAMRYGAEQAYNGHWQMNDIQYFGQLINNPKYELMQFTGLLDKNGKEIYEGDVIGGTSYLYGYELKNGRQFDYFGVVEWGAQADVGLCWMVSNKQGSWELRQTVHRNDIDYCTGEIIGNIYENPEMLEVE